VGQSGGEFGSGDTDRRAGFLGGHVCHIPICFQPCALEIARHVPLMAHQRKNSVAAASSLFGSADSAGQDFFSSMAEEPQTVTAQDDLFNSSSTSNEHGNASSLFGGSGQGTQELWDQNVNFDTTPANPGWVGEGTQAGTQVDDPYAAQGYYDNYGQWQEYPQDNATQQNYGSFPFNF
jgi:hypothetical protein